MPRARESACQKHGGARCRRAARPYIIWSTKLCSARECISNFYLLFFSQRSRCDSTRVRPHARARKRCLCRRSHTRETSAGAGAHRPGPKSAGQTIGYARGRIAVPRSAAAAVARARPACGVLPRSNGRRCGRALVPICMSGIGIGRRVRTCGDLRLRVARLGACGDLRVAGAARHLRGTAVSGRRQDTEFVQRAGTARFQALTLVWH